MTGAFQMISKYSSFAIALGMVVTLAACSSTEDKKTADNQIPVEQLYNKAAASMDKGEYFQAAKDFDEVDRQYPYSQWATKAQLMAGYAHYKNLKYDDAVIALDRFIELHPGDDDIPYAYYLKSLCYYEQISDVRRDQDMTQKALDALRQVVDRFPESKYAKDASLKVDLTVDHLAGKEMEIGRYYLERKQYQAAIPRFIRVLERFQTTTQVPEALHRLVEAYLALGIKAEAQKNAAILGYNYPESRWYKDSYRLMGDNMPSKNQPAPLPPAKPMTPAEPAPAAMPVTATKPMPSAATAPAPDATIPQTDVISP